MTIQTEGGGTGGTHFWRSFHDVRGQPGFLTRTADRLEPRHATYAERKGVLKVKTNEETANEKLPPGKRSVVRCTDSMRPFVCFATKVVGGDTRWTT